MNHPSAKAYYFTFAALMALLGATIAAAYFDLGKFNLPVAMMISVTKTALIILFFMHLKTANPLVKVAACAGFFFLAILLSLAMNDYFSRGWLP